MLNNTFKHFIFFQAISWSGRMSKGVACLQHFLFRLHSSSHEQVVQQEDIELQENGVAVI